MISKILVNRLKKTLGYIISPTRSAFVPNRLISDNYMIAFEAFHSVLTPSFLVVALKADISKAYDKLDWDFILNMLSWMGFHDTFVRQIQTCISTVTYSALFNGNSTEIVYPKRGICQGDPLSPYLFVLST